MLATKEEAGIKPLVHTCITVPGGRLVFSSACFPGDHWSLKRLREPEDGLRHAVFAEEVGCALRGIGVRRAYAPNPTEFNGALIEPHELHFPILLPHGVVMYRNTAQPADATYLTKSGDAGIFSAGGCGMVVVAWGELLLFAHAGRESLLDRSEVCTQGAQRGRPQGLVDNLVDALCAKGAHTRDLYAWPLYFIKPRHFVHAPDDPVHGEYNRGAIAYIPAHYGAHCGKVTRAGLLLDLPRIVQTQFVRRGVPKTNVSLAHAYLEDELPTTRNSENGRYLVAAVRH